MSLTISERADVRARACIYCGEVAHSWLTAEGNGWWFVDRDRPGVAMDDGGLVCAASACRSTAIADGCTPALDSNPDPQPGPTPDNGE